MLLYKAQPVAGQAIPDLRIEATEELPKTRFVEGETPQEYEPRWRAVFVAQAKLVVDALEASLPGGTMDQILVLMLQRRAVYWTRTVNEDG